MQIHILSLVEAASAVRRSTRTTLLALAVLGLGASAQAQWSQFGFSEGKTNANTAETTLSKKNVGQLSVKWSEPLSSLTSEATQNNGRMFVCGDGAGAGMFAIAPATGQVLWHQQVPGNTECGVPALDGTTAYVASFDFDAFAALTAFDQATGAQLWSTPLTTSSPSFGAERGIAMDAQRIYVSLPFERMAAVNRANGSVAWQTITDSEWTEVSAPSTGFGLVFLAGSRFQNGTISTLLALNAATGQQAWSASLGDETAYEPVVVLGSRVYAITAAGRLLGFDALTGQPQSALQLQGGGGFSQMAAHDDRIFVVTGQKYIQAIDVPSNTVLWSRTAGHGMKVRSDNVVWANHQLYLIARDRSGQMSLVVLRAADGKLVASLPFAGNACCSPPRLAVVDGRVVANLDGKLMAFGL